MGSLLSILIAAIYTKLMGPGINTYLPSSTSSPKPWALITGSTSGLGLALSHELASGGFNLILHGRNGSKLADTKAQLISAYPDIEIELLKLDAGFYRLFEDDYFSHISEKILAAVKDRNLTILVNNVGIGHHLHYDFRPLIEQDPSYISRLLTTNITFTTHLTRLLLPLFPPTTPSLILNIGSLASLSMPYLAIYSGTKAYLESFTKALSSELLCEGKATKVECHVFGDIDTPSHRGKQNWTNISAEKAAWCVVERMGRLGMWGGEPVACSYWGHAVLEWACGVQPWWMLRWGMGADLRGKKEGREAWEREAADREAWEADAWEEEAWERERGIGVEGKKEL